MDNDATHHRVFSVTDFQRLQSDDQQHYPDVNETTCIQLYEYTEQTPTSACDVNQFLEVQRLNKTESDVYNMNIDLKNSHGERQ